MARPHAFALPLPVVLPLLAVLLAAPASAAEPRARSGSPTAALLQAPSEGCRAAVQKAVRELATYLTPADVPADLFTASPVATLRTEKGHQGKPGVYEFNLWIGHYDQVCRVTMTGWASRLLPGCTCVHQDPVAAAEPYGFHGAQLVDAGRVRALEQACARSAHPLAAQAAEYRKANTRYVEFKIRLPALMEKARQTPSSQQRNEATDYARAKADLERGAFSQKAYDDQAKALEGQKGTALDDACKGANNLLTDKVVGMVMEMETFAILNKVAID
jgi:hypothetical protein